MKKLLALMTLVLLGTVNSVNAGTYDYLSNTGNGATTSWYLTAQTFTANASENLLSYAFMGGQNSQSTTFNFTIYDWTDSQNESSLFSTTSHWISGLNSISGINLMLQTGHIYAFVVDYLGLTDGGVLYGDDVYSGGNGFWSLTNGTWANLPMYDTAFKVITGSVSSVPVPAAVWLFVSGMAGLISIRRPKNLN